MDCVVNTKRHDTLGRVRREREDVCPSEDALMLVVYPGDSEVHPSVVRHLDDCPRCRLAVAGLLQSTPASPSGRERTFHDGELVADRYRILTLVGSGGMGDVYRVQDGLLKEEVALKTLASHVSANLEAIERIKAEVQLARRISHPNVCRIFDIGLHEADGASVFFLTMEMVEGETLRDLMVREAPLANELPRIVLQMAKALAAVHEGGVVHRDFKPENVMLARSADEGVSRVVVTDFGLARPLIGAELSPASGSGSARSLSGTPAYVAPELRRGAPVSVLSDVYAFGMVLLEMIYGHRNRIAGATSVGRDYLSLANRCVAPEPTRRISGFASIVREVEAMQVGTSRRGGGRSRWRALLIASAAAAVVAFAGQRAFVRGRSVTERSPFQTTAEPTSDAWPWVHASVPELTSTIPVDSTRRPRMTAGSAPARTRVVARERGAPANKNRPQPTNHGPAHEPPTSHLDQSPVGHRPSIEEDLQEADLLLLDGKIVEACALGERIRVTGAADVPAVVRFLGRCYMRAGRTAEARANYRRYLELAPGASDAPFVLGIIGHRS